MERFSILDWKKNEAITVIGILVFIFTISFYQVKIGEAKTRDAQRKSDVETIGRALRAYYTKWEVYPPEATGSGKIAACGNKGDQACDWGSGPMIDEDGVIYLNKIARDPKGDLGYTYVYEPAADRQHFRMYIALEYWNDKAGKSDLTRECGIGVQCKWYVQE